MGHKVNPFVHRLGIIRTWKSNWFNVKNYREYLKNDIEVRTYLEKKLEKASVENIIIERSSNDMTITISTARPGVVIGRGGTGIEDLRADVVKKVKPQKVDVKINIIEIKNPELSAMLVAQSVAESLEKRAPFRRTIKQAIERTMQNKTAQGVKVAVSGRLDGAEMARAEWLSEGKIPLQTLRADVDFAKYSAHTTFGVIGIKVWIYKGEIFNRK
ncbi:MAG: 30S ribosomal protein S3 [Candidatus Paceibacterota bacterium]